MPRFVTRVSAVAILIASSLALAGCSTPPWELNTASPTGIVSESAAPSIEATPTPAPSVSVFSNDLSAGSTIRTLQAGAATLTVQYWSTLNMGKWTADVNKPLTVKVSASLANDEGQSIYLSRVSALISVTGVSGTVGEPLKVDDTSTISPGYLIKSPYSYEETLMIPYLDPAARQITISISFDVLIQSTPTSTDFAKQAASDTLQIAIVGAQQ